MTQKITYIIPIFLFTILAITALNAQQAMPTGQEIVEKMTDIMAQESSKGVVRQIITTSSGQERIFEFEMYTAGEGEKTLMRYLKPAAAKGQTFLMLNNAEDIWTYFPRTNRVRKLASSSKNQKVQGSDFSYEDLGSGDTWTKEYVSTNLGAEKYAGEECWKLESIGIPKENPAYPKMIVYVRKTDNHPMLIDYYDDKDGIEKSLLLSAIEEIEGVPTALSMKMVNHDEGSETIMETISITYKWTPPNNFFSERTLKR